MFEARNGDISTLLPPGTVAYSMTLSGSRLRVPSTVSVGDRVDMLAEIRSKIANDTFLITVAEGLLIVSIERGTPKDEESSVERVTREDSFLNNMTSRKKHTETLVPRAIVLALTREQVQDIELVKSANADFTLLLRGQAEDMVLTSGKPRTLNEYLRTKGIDLSAQAAAKQSTPSVPTITIIRGVDSQEIPIQKASPK